MSGTHCILATRTLPGDTLTPVTLYQAYAADGQGFLLESAEEGRGRYTFIGKADGSVIYDGKVTRVRETGKPDTTIPGDPFAALTRVLDNYRVEDPVGLPFAGGLVGYLGYDMVRCIEELPARLPDTLGIPSLQLILCTRFLAIDHRHHTLTLAALVESGPGCDTRAQQTLDSMEEAARRSGSLPLQEESRILSVEDVLPREPFMDAVQTIRSHIIRGDIFQTVLSRRYVVRASGSPFGIYRNLRQINPSPYMFYLDFGDFQLLGSSPEMLAEKRGDRIRTCPIAGTRPRGGTPAEDEALSRELQDDPKELAEHMMLVDLGRNDMGRIARPGTVSVPRLREVHRYSHVMHLVSLVEGLCEPGAPAPEVLRAFLPAGTLSGAPKIRAMEIIESLEPVRRSFYGGCVGYFGFDGDMDTCITIRSLLARGRQLTVQAGAGIVYDSDPATEYQETENKLQAALRAVQPEGEPDHDPPCR